MTPDVAVGAVGESVRIDVLANDSDPEGYALTLVSVAAPLHGNVYIETVNGHSQLVYIANQSSYNTESFAYSDSFNYTLRDNFGNVTIQSVTVNLGLIKVIKLLNDTGTANDQITYDQTIGVMAKSPAGGGAVQFEFDRDNDGVADKTESLNFTNGVEALPLFYHPGFTTPGTYTVAVRSLIPDAVTGLNLTSQWVATTFTLIARDDAPAIASLTKSTATAQEQYQDGSGNIQTRTLALPPNQIQGVVGGTASQKAYVTIEFDHDNDGIIDGATTASADGEFVYNPTGLNAGSSVTIQARTRTNDANSSLPAYGSWSSITFTTGAVDAPVITNINLNSRLDENQQNDTYLDEEEVTHYDSSWWTTSEPLLLVNVDPWGLSDPVPAFGFNVPLTPPGEEFMGSGEPEQIVRPQITTFIQVDQNGDGTVDGESRTQNTAGAFTYRMTGLTAGTHTIKVRGVVYNLELGSYIIGDWTDFTFIYQPDQATVINGLTNKILIVTTSRRPNVEIRAGG